MTNLKVNTHGGDPVTVYTGNFLYIEYTAYAPNAEDTLRSVKVVIWDSGGGYVKSTCDVIIPALEGPGHSRNDNACLTAPDTPGTYTLELIPYSGSDCTSGDVGTSATCTLTVEAGPTTTDASGSAGTILSGESFTISAQVTSCVSNPCLIGSHIDDSCDAPRQLIGTVTFRDVTAGVDLGTQSIWEVTTPYGDETVQLVTTDLLKHPTESIHTIAVMYEPSVGTPWHDDSSDTFQVTVLSDTEAPQITCPGAKTADCDTDACTASVSFEATATDNVSATVTYNISGTPITSPYDFPLGPTTVTAVATDPSGNTDTCTFTVTVSDTQAPVVTCPANTSGECDSGCDPADTGQATATDNCGTPTITYVDVFTPSGCGNTGTIARTWTATDDAGNSDSCIQTITVVDNTPPVITCPSDRTLEVGQSTMPVNTGYATAVDGCGTAEVTWTDSFIFTGCESSRTITRTWTATDECGNSSTCDQIINMVDTTPPSITCPADVSVQCLIDVPTANPASVETSDSNDPSPVVTHEGDDTLQTGLGAYVITRTYRSTDCADNWVECTQTITVDDTIAPVITLPAGTSGECNSGCDPADTGQATATDNCGTPTITYVDAFTPSGCGNTGTIARTWTATDDAGNSDSCTQTIVVVDNTPPVITCPSDTTLEVGQSTTPANTGSATAVDGCGTADVTWTDSFTSTGCGSARTITRTWTATDECGNNSSCDQMIYVVDSTPPSITCPADVSVQCLADVPAVNPASVATSDGNDPSPIVTHEGDDTLQTGLGSYVITRTYRSTDCADNWTECTQTITVDDTIAPVITLDGTSPMTVECGSTYNEPGATVTDNCCVDSGDLVIDASSVDTSVVGSYAVTYNIDDCAGNAATQVTRTVIVADTSTPVITLLGENPLSILEGGTYTEAGADVSDACPGCVNAGDLVIDSSAVDTSTPGTYAVTYDIVDCHGNAGHEVRTVQVLDITPPKIEIRTPANLAVYLLHEIVLADWTVSGADGGTITASTPDGSPINTMTGGEHVFSVTAVDASGNTASAAVAYSVQYQLLIDPATGVLEFVIVAEGDDDAAPPEEFLAVTYGLPIHIGFALLDVAGEAVLNLQLALTIVRVLPGDDGETYEILHLITVDYDEESGCYAQTLCEAEGILLEPGLYDLWLGLGDGRSLRQRIVVEEE